MQLILPLILSVDFVTIGSAETMRATTPSTAPVAEAAQRITTLDLLAVRDIEGLSVSPNGEWAAFQLRRADPELNRYDTYWYVVATTGGSARRVAGAGEPIRPSSRGRVNGTILTTPPAWSQDSEWIAYLKSENGRTQVWRTRRDGRYTEQLTHNKGDVHAIAYSKDGRKLLFETSWSRAQHDAAAVAEGSQGYVYDDRFLPSYSPLPIVSQVNHLHKANGKPSVKLDERVWAYDFRKNKERPALAAEQEEFAILSKPQRPKGRQNVRGDVAVSPGGALAWTEALDSTLQGLRPPITIVAHMVGTDGPAIICAAVECTSPHISGLWWRNEGEVVFVRREGPALENQAFYAWKPSDATLRLITRSHALLTSSNWKCAMGGGRLICFCEEPSRPRRLVAINVDSGAIETIYEPNGAFAQFELGPQPERLWFRSASGIENYGYLVRPPGRNPAKRLPLIIVTYRCSGFLRGGTGDEYPIFPFAANGFAVFCFNTPDIDYALLASMDAVAYENWARGPGDPQKHRVQEGLEAAVEYLNKAGIVDPARVAVTGLSFGAETVSFAIAHSPIFAAAIASGTEIGPASTFLFGPEWTSAARSWGLDSPVSQRWASLSLARNANRVRTPLLLNVPDHEMISSLEAVAALKAANRDVEMYVFPNEYHVKWQPTHRLAIYNRNIDWMNFWLQGREDLAPEKAEQYKRWRAMRENQCRFFGPNGSERAHGEVLPWYCRLGALDVTE